MKIFISHSSKNKDYGNVLVELLQGVGVKEDEIIFTSNNAYGIPIGQNIYNWLKSQIAEKPFVIYLLSKEYYESIACLNEMGAAWIIENEHAMLFTPNFDLSSKEFQNGAIDPREIGFYIDDEERLLSFLHHLDKYFSVSKNPILINQKIKKYLEEIEVIKGNKSKIIPTIVTQSNLKTKEEILIKKEEKPISIINETAKNINQNTNDLYSKFISEILAGKLKDEEMILLHYVSETGRLKLMTGWQLQTEIDNIKVWEEIHEIDNILSRNYENIIRKFEIRGYTEASAFTVSNNPKEVKLKSEIEAHILDLPIEINEKIKLIIEKNPIKPKKEEWPDLPF
jgi:hypothetical protein